MIFVDSNVLIDIFSADQDWKAWSDGKIDQLNADGEQLVIDLVVIAELSANFATLSDLLATLEKVDIEAVPMDEAVAFAAGQAFRAYRRKYRVRDAILADFLIGAHARYLGAALLTRDVAIYRTYFPDLTLITPETHP